MFLLLPPHAPPYGDTPTEYKYLLSKKVGNLHVQAWKLCIVLAIS